MSDQETKAAQASKKTVLASSGSGPILGPVPPAGGEPAMLGVADTFVAPGGVDAAGRPITGPTAHHTVLGASGAVAARQGGGPRLAVTAPEITTGDSMAGVPLLPVVDPSSLVGSVVADRYRILKVLGQGGMGVVYLAEHVVIEKRVALKLLNEDLTHSRDAVSRFIYEAKAASKIGHENIIDINDFGTIPDGGVFFVMEYLEGCDLSDLLADSGRLSWERCQRIGAQVCRALAAAHGKGIIHRDLKPENIFLIHHGGRDDFVKILDFGIAKFTGMEGGAPRQTKTGMIFGTPDYMAPEQAETRNADHRVDIYSLGVILYQLVTGRLPFQAETFMGVLHQHMTKIATPPRELEPSLPPSFDAIIRRALEKNPDLRFQTMQELCAAIEQVQPVSPGGPSVKEAPNLADPETLDRDTALVASPSARREPAAAPAAPSTKKSATLSRLVLLFLLVAVLTAGGILLVSTILGNEKNNQTTGPGSEGPRVVSKAPVDAQAPRQTPDAIGRTERPVLPGPVKLRLVTRPDRAEVLLDGRPVGYTPLENLTLPHGREEHVILLSKPGYRSQEIRFSPDSNQSWERVLERGRGLTRVEPGRARPMDERPRPMDERPPPMDERPPPMDERPPSMDERPRPMDERPRPMGGPMDSDLKVPF